MLRRGVRPRRLQQVRQDRVGGEHVLDRERLLSGRVLLRGQLHLAGAEGIQLLEQLGLHLADLHLEQLRLQLARSRLLREERLLHGRLRERNVRVRGLGSVVQLSKRLLQRNLLRLGLQLTRARRARAEFVAEVERDGREGAFKRLFVGEAG